MERPTRPAGLTVVHTATLGATAVTAAAALPELKPFTRLRHSPSVSRDVHFRGHWSRRCRRRRVSRCRSCARRRKDFATFGANTLLIVHFLFPPLKKFPCCRGITATRDPFSCDLMRVFILMRAPSAITKQVSPIIWWAIKESPRDSIPNADLCASQRPIIFHKSRKKQPSIPPKSPWRTSSIGVRAKIRYQFAGYIGRRRT